LIGIFPRPEKEGSISHGESKSLVPTPASVHTSSQPTGIHTGQAHSPERKPIVKWIPPIPIGMDWKRELPTTVKPIVS